MYLEASAQRAKNSNRSYPHVRFDKDQENWVINTASIFREIAQKILDGQDRSEIALYAHGALVASTTEVLIELSATTNLRTVVLAGGCFQNIILLKELTKELEMAGFRVLCSLEVPPNDGGISLGQVAIAAARLGQTSSPKAIT
jgi:hydrogenase maturation protein HypF